MRHWTSFTTLKALEGYLNTLPEGEGMAYIDWLPHIVVYTFFEYIRGEKGTDKKYTQIREHYLKEKQNANK